MLIDQALPQLTAKLYPFKVELYRFDQTEPLAVHPRCYDRNHEIIAPLHYLTLIRQRPEAIDHTKSLRRWGETWPAVYDELLAHQCGHLVGVQVWLTQQQRVEPSFTSLTLANQPRLCGIGEQSLSAGTYDELLGGGQ